MPDLAHLAQLIQTRNAVHREIAALIGRPAHAGHVGEYIAAALRARGTQIGVAASVTRPLWDAAEIWPAPRNPRWTLSAEQQDMLALFR